jgi:hypothetical protein
MDIRSWNRAEFIEKGAGIKCPGQKRLALLSPEPAPMDLNCLRKKETAKNCPSTQRGRSMKGRLPLSPSPPQPPPPLAHSSARAVASKLERRQKFYPTQSLNGRARGNVRYHPIFPISLLNGKLPSRGSKMRISYLHRNRSFFDSLRPR